MKVSRARRPAAAPGSTPAASEALVGTEPPPSSGGRSAYLDNLRSLVVFLVVVMHSNVTYSGIGGWYFKEGVEASLDLFSRIVFGFYGSFVQAWFMGVLFFTAAYFAARSLAKRGGASFVKERLVRLGVPVLLYVFVVHPIAAYVLLDHGGSQGLAAGATYLRYLAELRWVGSTGPLWFAQALLAFCLAYAAYRSVRPRRFRAGSGVATSHGPRTCTLAWIVLATGAAAFAIRLVFPIGSAVLNLQFSFFASYLALFLLGIDAGERGWLEAFLERRGMQLFRFTLAVGIPAWIVLMIAGGALTGAIPIEGGMRWQSFAYAFWEAFVAVGFSLGIAALFRKYFDRETKFTRVLSANAFGVYVFHAPLLIAVSLLLRSADAPMLAKHLVAAPTAFAVSLGFTALVRLVPPARRLLR